MAVIVSQFFSVLSVIHSISLVMRRTVADKIARMGQTRMKISTTLSNAGEALGFGFCLGLRLRFKP